MVKYAHLIPLFPFLAFAINILFGRKLKRASALVSIVASSVALLVAAVTFVGNLTGEGSYTVAKWLSFSAGGGSALGGNHSGTLPELYFTNVQFEKPSRAFQIN